MTRAIVLAAGQGKRMQSALPKVLHEVCGRSMLHHVVQALRNAQVSDIVLVASRALADSVEAQALEPLHIVVQHEPQGTGDAVRLALAALPPVIDGKLLIACADMPLLTSHVFQCLLEALDTDVAMALVTARMGPRSSFGRIVRAVRAPDASIERIVELRDCTPEERELDEMNAGLYAFQEAALREVLPKVGNSNAQGEYYLTDTLALLRGAGRRIKGVLIEDTREVLGVNDRVELSQAQAAMNAQLCELHMRAGVTIIDPRTTYLEPGVAIGRDTTIYPNTSISGSTNIGRQAIIGPQTRLQDATIGDRSSVRESVVIGSRIGADCEIGPFAHIRMDACLADDVRIGNFVEIKKSRLAQRVRAGHLSYMGDAQIGEAVNIGAGTITCNYDGEKKHQTQIGANAFIGSNSSLIAPVTIGEGALTGAGSVVTRDVAAGERVVGNPARALVMRSKP